MRNLEKRGYTKAKVNGHIYRIYSEVNFKDMTIQLLDEWNNVVEIKVYEIDELIKG